MELSLSSLHLKLSLSSLHLKQRQDGPFCLTYRLSASYYNREQSAWEPCMEPWGCTVDRLSSQLSSKTQRNAVTIKSDEVVNLNLTSNLLELFQVVRANWGEYYFSQGERRRRGARRGQLQSQGCHHAANLPAAFCRTPCSITLADPWSSTAAWWLQGAGGRGVAGSRRRRGSRVLAADVKTVAFLRGKGRHQNTNWW